MRVLNTHRITREWQRTAVFTLLSVMLLTVCVTARSQNNFDPSTPARFDGHSWNQLTLDQSTTDDIKRAYKTSKGAYRPEAMVLPQPSRSEAQVQVLMDGRGGNSRLIGFRLAYRDIGPDLRQLAADLNEQPETVFPHERFSDWRLQIFPRRGIAAFTVREGAREMVPLLLLTTSDRLKRLVRGFSGSSSPIGNLRTRFNLDKVRIEFGSVSINHEESGLKLNNAGSLETAIRTQAKRDPGSPNLRFATGSNGDYRVHISLEKPKYKEGMVSASVWVNGDSPFGKTSATGFGSATFARGLFGDVNVSHDVILDAFRQARSQMGNAFTSNVRKGLPSSPKAYREQIWNALTDSAVR